MVLPGSEAGSGMGSTCGSSVLGVGSGSPLGSAGRLSWGESEAMLGSAASGRFSSGAGEGIWSSGILTLSSSGLAAAGALGSSLIKRHQSGNVDV